MFRILTFGHLDCQKNNFKMSKKSDRASAFERRVAKDFGSTRIGNDGQSHCDVHHDVLEIECKRLKSGPKGLSKSLSLIPEAWAWHVPLSDLKIVLMHSKYFFKASFDDHKLLSQFIRSLQPDLNPKRKKKSHTTLQINQWFVRFYDNHWPKWLLDGYRQAFWYANRGQIAKIPLLCRDNVFFNDQSSDSKSGRGHGYFLAADVEHWSKIASLRPKID